MNEIFESNRNFKMWAYTVSHSSLILRSEMRYPDQDDSENYQYNIDLEFLTVQYINIPSTFKTLRIREITEKELPQEIDRDLLMYGMKTFELQTNGNKYYIISGSLLIAKNVWYNEDRIFNYNANLKHDEIIFSTN